MGGMAWTDDLLTAQYTSPSGKTIPFRYVDVTKEVDLKTSTYTFPSKDGALVQSLGRGGRRFPLECVFTGAGCIADADAFDAALEERGYGELQHPVYGTRKVVPTGSIKRSDPLATGGNVSTITVTFSETITDTAMPDSAVNQADAIAQDFEAVEDLACADFAGGVAYTNASEQIKLTTTLNKNMATSYLAMADAAKSNLSANDTLWQTFQALKKQGYEFVNGIGKTINAPLNFARTLYNIYKLPSKLVVSLLKTVDGYTGAYASLLTDFITDPVGAVNVANQFHSTNLSLLATITSLGNALATVAGDTDARAASRGTPGAGGSNSGGVGFRNREEAVEAVSTLNELLDTYTGFVDKYDKKDVFVDTSETYYALQKLAADVERYVLEVAFDLPTKRIITLGRDRQLLELLTELYGNLDHLDEFIMDNNLNADELEVLPMGREVCYYA